MTPAGRRGSLQRAVPLPEVAASRSLWPAAVTLVAAGCSRPPNPEEAARRVVGIWRHVRENGRPVAPRTDVSGLLQLEADGTIGHEQVTDVTIDGKLESRKVRPTRGRYRFLDAETMEITGDDRGEVRTWTVRAVLDGNRLTLHKPHGQVDEFERVK